MVEGEGGLTESGVHLVGGIGGGIRCPETGNSGRREDPASWT